MAIPRSELHFEFMRGTGPGGQHRNKTDSACRVTHLPTGITAYADERSQSHSRKKALAELERRIIAVGEQRRADERKGRRDDKVRNRERAIRTYDFKSGVVTDHRTGKKASVKDVLRKGKIDLLMNDPVDE